MICVYPSLSLQAEVEHETGLCGQDRESPLLLDTASLTSDFDSVSTTSASYLVSQSDMESLELDDHQLDALLNKSDLSDLDQLDSKTITGSDYEEEVMVSSRPASGDQPPAPARSSEGQAVAAAAAPLSRAPGPTAPVSGESSSRTDGGRQAGRKGSVHDLIARFEAPGGSPERGTTPARTPDCGAEYTDKDTAEITQFSTGARPKVRTESEQSKKQAEPAGDTNGRNENIISNEGERAELRGLKEFTQKYLQEQAARNECGEGEGEAG